MNKTKEKPVNTVLCDDCQGSKKTFNGEEFEECHKCLGEGVIDEKLKGHLLEENLVCL